MVRYQIATAPASAKATGGAISFYGGKTIHTFTSSGDFNNTSGASLSVEYIVVGGGGLEDQDHMHQPLVAVEVVQGHTERLQDFL